MMPAQSQIHEMCIQASVSSLLQGMKAKGKPLVSSTRTQAAHNQQGAERLTDAELAANSKAQVMWCKHENPSP